MLVLGWHGRWQSSGDAYLDGWSAHDAAAALVKDGEIVAAYEEERLSRLKHSSFFPHNAISACLQQAGVSFSDIDVIACNFRERIGSVFSFDQGVPSINNFLDDPKISAFGPRELVTEAFSRHFGEVSEQQLEFFDHHICHFWSALAFGSVENALQK